MIDVHCHLLPGVDDGPVTLLDAVELARASVLNGITHAITTPHAYPGRWDNDLANLQPVFANLQKALEAEAIPLKIKLGSEVHITEYLPQQVTSGSLPFLGQSKGYRVLLLEMPDGHIPVGIGEAVRYLIKQRIRPLIAHPERNKAIMADPSRIDELVKMGCWLQGTAGSLLGQFGPRVQTAMLYLIEQNRLYLVASDCHNLHGRPPNLAQAAELLARQHGEAYARMLVLDRPAELYDLDAI